MGLVELDKKEGKTRSQQTFLKAPQHVGPNWDNCKFHELVYVDTMSVHFQRGGKAPAWSVPLHTSKRRPQAFRACEYLIHLVCGRSGWTGRTSISVLRAPLFWGKTVRILGADVGVIRPYAGHASRVTRCLILTRGQGKKAMVWKNPPRLLLEKVALPTLQHKYFFPSYKCLSLDLICAETSCMILVKFL